MTGNERFEDSIGKWLEEAAPIALPQRVLTATFERTRRTRQATALRTVLGRRTMPRYIPALGATAAVVAAAVLALNVGLISGPGDTPSPSASPTSRPTSGALWPQSTLEEVQAAQRLADELDPRFSWQVAPDLEAHLGQGGPFREEIFARFLEQKLGWEDFHWTLLAGVSVGQRGDHPTVFFRRCAPSPTDVFLVGGCEPTIDGLRYERVGINVAQLDRKGPSGIWVVTSWQLIEPFEPPPSPEPDVVELLNGFLGARVGGRGAEQFLGDPEQEVPLLYATTAGIPYDGGGFGEVHGYEWPYGWRAFNVWLEVDGPGVVNQLLFMPPDGRRRLEYVPDGFGTDIPPTIDGTWPLPAPYTTFAGEVTLHVAHPWVFRSNTTSIRLVPSDMRVQPTTDGGERNDWDRLVLMADPARPACQTGAAPVDARALAESLRSDPNLVTTAPVATSAEGAAGIWMDVSLASGGSAGCGTLYGLTELGLAEFVSLAAGDQLRLWLFDAPAGSSMQILAVVLVGRDSQFERATLGAASLSADFSTR